MKTLATGFSLSVRTCGCQPGSSTRWLWKPKLRGRPKCGWASPERVSSHRRSEGLLTLNTCPLLPHLRFNQALGRIGPVPSPPSPLQLLSWSMSAASCTPTSPPAAPSAALGNGDHPPPRVLPLLLLLTGISPHLSPLLSCWHLSLRSISHLSPLD